MPPRCTSLAHSLLFLCLLCACREGESSRKPGRPHRGHSRRAQDVRMLQAFRKAQEALGTTSKCPQGCTKYGTCNEELGRCDCPKHLSGPDCSQESSNITALCRKYGFRPEQCFDQSKVNCLNACNGRGKCIGGFCQCMPGFYGADCCLSLDPGGRPELLAGQGYQPRARRPHIYVYDLPPHLNNVWFNPTRLDRPLFYLFWQRLLSAGARVADGDEADYYFIPVKARMGAHDDRTLLEAVGYIRQHWPWWDKHGGGGRHIVIQTGDMGRVESSLQVQALLYNATWLTHWGLRQEHKHAGWKSSHRPGQDIVVPVYVQPALVQSYGMHHSPLHPGIAQAKPRSQTFFFAGRVCGDRKPPLQGVWPNCDLQLGGKDSYSAGTRQKIHFHHWNRSGYQIVTSTKTYGKDMARSTFCLAPTGGGHGKRNVLVTMMGCVPVTVTDGVYQPFEPELNWKQFSVTLPEADIPRLHDILAAIPQQQLAVYQSKLWCAAQHIFWSSIYGGVLGDDGRYDAFETVLQILRVRLLHPGLAPEQYADKDEDFRRFMKCESVPKQEPPELCSFSKVESSAFPCAQCSRGDGGKLGLPGGAICCTQKELAKCPRLWP